MSSFTKMESEPTAAESAETKAMGQALRVRLLEELREEERQEDYEIGVELRKWITRVLGVDGSQFECTASIPLMGENFYGTFEPATSTEPRRLIVYMGWKCGRCGQVHKYAMSTRRSVSEFLHAKDNGLLKCLSGK